MVEKYYDFWNQDAYLSKKMIQKFLETMEIVKEEVLLWFEQLAVFRNDCYVEWKLIEEKEYFDTMFLGYDDAVQLDIEQRKAILMDEDYMMIIAGAGSGKTTTMAAKVKYLIERRGVPADSIIVISYTKKAVLELTDRIVKQFGLMVTICTFHKFGLTILKQYQGDRFEVNEQGEEIIKKYLEKILLYDRKVFFSFFLFFRCYLDVPKSSLLFPSLAHYHDFSSRVHYLTLKGEVQQYHESLMHQQVSLQKEFLRSKEEVRIANYLFLHGIDYVYDQIYPYTFFKKLYFPTFTIIYGNCTYYLDFFPVMEGERGPFKKKKERIMLLHSFYRTKFLILYAQYLDGRDMLVHLHEMLENLGFELQEKDEYVLDHYLLDGMKEQYYRRFVSFCLEFIKGMKVRGCCYEDFKKWREIYQSNQKILYFLDIVEPMFYYYNRELWKLHRLDFEDMVNMSCQVLQSSSSVHLPYQYVVIDEYQDISRQRAELILALAKVSDAKIVAVGDDWQAIFSFAGSDVSLFTQFQQWMGYALQITISHTYRNSQELIDIAGEFVMQNSQQIQKKLCSSKHVNEPVVLVEYEDEHYQSYVDAVCCCIDAIVSEYSCSKTILLIGRYSFDIDPLLKSPYFVKEEKEQIRYVPNPFVKIYFLTVHSAKGLGFDNVVLLNGRDDLYGFPSKLVNDEIMQLLEERESFLFAEERRLFYVALTRTKNKVYIVLPKHRPSIFLRELSKNPLVVCRKNRSMVMDYRCPKCGGILSFEPSSDLIPGGFYICSNAMLCGFRTNNLRFKKEIQKCPRCRQGYLIVKQGSTFFLGCTCYRQGCLYTESL